MALTNVYEKSYLTTRRVNNDDEIYILVLFKSDNTFIIKRKSNLHGANDNGLVTIKDRGKTYVGYCLLEGSLTEVEAAAERLDKQMNSDLESDCETLKSSSKLNVQRSQQITTSAPSSNSSIQISGTSKNYGTPPPTDVAVHSKAMRGTSPKRANGVAAYQALREVQYMVKNKENERQTRKSLTFDDDLSEGDSDDDKSSEEVIDLDNSSLPISVTTDKNNTRPSKRPLSNSFNKTAREKSSKRICNKLFPLEDGGNKEIVMLLKASLSLNQDVIKSVDQSSKDIKHMLVSMEKFIKNQNGESIDLIQLYGVRTQLGRFATLLMDQLFTKEELVSISKDELIKDGRYQIIKEAVRSKFQLNIEMLNLEWPNLHESILQKRRNEIKKSRASINSIKPIDSPLQETVEEHVDETDTF
ncbi:unnamed protein product [Rotaria magnacalcarata]